MSSVVFAGYEFFIHTQNALVQQAVQNATNKQALDIEKQSAVIERNQTKTETDALTGVIKGNENTDAEARKLQIEVDTAGSSPATKGQTDDKSAIDGLNFDTDAVDRMLRNATGSADNQRNH